jgi:ornithine cyclodeaminase/alanine dehydrogenase-like protein (mu-crystallin family)
MSVTADESQLVLLAGDQVAPLLEPDAVLDAVRRSFELHSAREGRVFPLVREKLHTGGIFGIKSGDVPKADLLGFKAAGFWPANRQVGKEPHQATILLFDPHTGRPLCIIDGNAITTLRTGAAGAIGLTLLARPESRSICVFGTGTQGRIQLRLALRAMPGLDTIYYLTADGRPDAAFEAAFEDFAPAHTIQAAKAVGSSDIIITATPGSGPLFPAEAVRPGAHINAVGTDTQGKRELPDGLLRRVRLFTDDCEQSATVGEGQWDTGCRATEIGDLLIGKIPFTRDATDITVFDMTGLALQDLTVADMLWQQARSRETGTRVPWRW